MTRTGMGRAVQAGLRLLPGTRQELARAMLAEAAALEPGPARRAWLRDTWWFVAKAAMPVVLRWAAILGSALFILWILYNGVDSGFQGTPVQVVSYLALILLLALDIVLVTRRGR